MERFKRWWRWHKGDVFFFLGIACAVAFLVAVINIGHTMGRDCMDAGYTRYKDGYCVRQVKGTDELAPYEAVVK